MHQRQFWTYIMASPSGTLYIGMTNDIERRVYEHKHKLIPGFSAKYNTTKLVHLEDFIGPLDAIAREKQLKGWVRRRKVALIEETNPEWRDLAADWGLGR